MLKFDRLSLFAEEGGGNESYKNVGKFNCNVMYKIAKSLKFDYRFFLSSLIFSQTSTSVRKVLQNARIFATTNPVRTLASVTVVFSWEPTVALAKVSHIGRKIYLRQIFTD